MELITKYNGLTGLEYARKTLKEKTVCAWHLGDKILHEDQEITQKEMNCIRSWVVEKVERIENTDHIYLNENNH